MLNRIITLTIALTTIICAQAQEVCIIKGVIENDSLAYSDEKIKKVYLARIDESERMVNIDSAKVKKGKYTFKYKMQKDEPVMMYFITGFDNGQINVFLEPGKISINTEKASYPSNSKVSGTPTNDLYVEYKKIYGACVQEQMDTLHALLESKGEDWMNSDEGFQYRLRKGALSIMKCNSNRIKFLLDNNDSPLAPLMFHREIINMIDDAYAQQIVNTINPSLHNHPYYRSLSNSVLAREIKEGSVLPDITIPLHDGTQSFLNDYRGKFVLLHFWASWCTPCKKSIPVFKKLYDETRKYADKFTIVGFSLDKNKEEWLNAIKEYDIDQEGWIHGSDLLSWGSPTIKMLNIGGIPYTFLLDPEGRLISQTLLGEELIEKVLQIMEGDLYYLDKQE